MKFAQKQDHHSANLLPARMPAVGSLADQDGFFSRTRNAIAETLAETPHLAIVTPERKILWTPTVPASRVARSEVEEIKRLLPSNGSLRISVIASTISEPSLKKLSETIPFLGFLFGFATAGHNVLVFEGHPEVFEQGVRWSDVLLIDSGMLPFLQSDWFEVATKVMTPGARILLHDREQYDLCHVLRKSGERADQVDTISAEPGGELSYMNCLLTVMGRGGPSSAEIASGEPLPDLTAMELTDPKVQLWVSTLPFRHEMLDPDRVINATLQLAGRRWFHVFQSSWRFQVKVAIFSELLDVFFQVSLSRLGRRRKLLIKRLEGNS